MLGTCRCINDCLSSDQNRRKWRMSATLGNLFVQKQPKVQYRNNIIITSVCDAEQNERECKGLTCC